MSGERSDPMGTSYAIWARLGDIDSKVGNLEGQLAAVLRDNARLLGQLDLHLADDREIHAKADTRLLQAINELTDRIANARGAIEARVDAIERGIGERLAERRTSEKWRSAIMTAIGTASGYIGGWVSRWPWTGHH